MYTAKVHSSVTATVPTTHPPGSILAYLGTSDPDGWVIADGQVRTNGGGDGRYYNLIQMGIYKGTSGSNSLANYTPPDLKGAFLRGGGVCDTNINYNGGAIKNTQIDMIGTHAHSVNFPSHTHSYEENYIIYTAGKWTLVHDGLEISKGDFSWISSVVNSDQVINTGSTSINVTLTSSMVSGETRPYNYGVNWIIKL